MKILYYLSAVFLAMSCVSPAFSQAKTRKLSSVINHPSFNVYSPYLSADANALVFVSDNAEDNVLTPFYTLRDGGDWMEPQPLPKHIYTRLNSLNGFALSADGKKLFYATLKTPGVGGFDIWTSDLKGTTWSQPTNLALPVNSKGHEGSPSVSADGSTMYFMRCDKMDQNKADACKLFSVSKKVNGQWGEPVELPASINTGNSQSPRIMADGETLFFASNKFPGGKGGMDLYVTKFVNGTWSAPKAVEFINTPGDDQHISISALGRYLTRDTKGARRNEIVEYLIPAEYRPRGMMKIDGSVLDPNGAPIPAYVSIMDLTKNKRYYNGRPYADGSFIVYVMEGSKYELSVDAEQDNASYFSKQLDLTSLEKIPQVEKVSVVLKPITSGDELPLDGVAFKAHTSELDVAQSSADIKRFLRVVKGNPSKKFEIQVLLSGYEEDSVQSNPDLTEVVYDSIAGTYDEIDTLGQLYQEDTVYVKARYHNDRTWQQAKAVVDYLVSQGVNEGALSTFANAIPATLPENRKTVVKVRVK